MGKAHNSPLKLWILIKPANIYTYESTIQSSVYTWKLQKKKKKKPGVTICISNSFLRTELLKIEHKLFKYAS